MNMNQDGTAIMIVPVIGNDFYFVTGGKKMKDLTSAQIRQMFLDYFAENGHMIEPGASLVPHNDPTLLWINAGVAALKKYFDGTEKPKSRRITNAQKSIRTNDIENVGKTARHHTFFEMLGNFSIGDYFKKEAIPFAWHFLTDERWMGFDKEKLYITVYIDDQEAFDIWTKECGVDPKHILRTPDNFWEIGSGPCGPDSEIFYDRGEKYDPNHLGERAFFEELENDRYIEIWNVVFSQFNSEEGVERKDYKELPQKNIDTGMGLERLVCIVQDGETNFDTDLFLPIIRATEAMTDKKYENGNKMAYRVIADHIRTVTFALADGALFSNEGRGYILRRVLRRAVRYGKSLGIKGAYMYKLVPVVADNMIDYYPYLQEKVEYIQKLVKAEEERFQTTLTEGEKILQEYLKNAETKVLDGETVFKMYDTFGFPKELTQEIAEEKGFTIDIEGFNKAMAAQRQRARDARVDAESMSSQQVDLMNFETSSKFVGYDCFSCEATVIGLFKNGVKVDVLEEEGEVIFDQTCFYAESGGQLYDKGTAENEIARMNIEKVEKAPLKQHLHFVKVENGFVKVGDRFNLAINVEERKATMANHSAVHLLQAALQKVVGSHVHQAGSYVSSEYARFDFTHFEKVTAEQLKEIEDIVNREIAANYPVVTDLMNIDEAKQTGAMALFDEKYDEIVRVVSMGNVSKELCGGTHVKNTAEIGSFKIVSEESIGSGIRRITLVTSYGAYKYALQQQNTLNEIAGLLKLNSVTNVVNKVSQMLDENAGLRQTISQLKNQLLAANADELAANAIEKDGMKVLVTKVDCESSQVKGLANLLLSKMKEGIVFLAAENEGKVMFAAKCSQKAIDNGYKASDLVKQAAIICGGNGGGRADEASAGGKDVTKLEEAVKAVRQLF